MEYIGKVTGWIKGLAEMGLAVLSLAIVVQVLFGSGAPFLPGDIIANVVGIVKQLGSEGLVGLVAVWVLLSIYNRKAEG
jgi:hypothetical protein